MGKGVFIIGTDTDVGKTFVSAGITYMLRKNEYKACYFKPIQSGGIIPIDVKFVKDVCHIEERYDFMNSYCFEEGVSPHLASKIENITIKKEKILDTYKELIKKYDYVVVEGAGGIIVPLIGNEYYIYNLVKDLKLPCVIVARAGVGTINHTILTYEFAKSKGIYVKGIIINEYSGKFYEEDNINIIKNITKLKVISKISKLENLDKNTIKNEYEKNINIDNILELF
ncbi:dethiobiotin synthase [Tepidibacter formicigenes]|uniref:ATP-dependent dethiobiotin synthetase BioD n=1 Tax=Tepidibacter formicigenes DSM 15518 TaxID=1123349 RepID=A0A1M6JQ37_9FIRM|nr:dethiobiotin synthase [Tepidibacter formicigenes]SHJ48703.1 dethiobiotin synthetase [Tepidibacter formicigenes DSM 15518]